jgi:glycosyltransferase involved in cell wall biosynthesis
MSPGAPKVTIGLPVRNGERFLERAIDSVLGQTFDDLELVISDNASTDRTQEICASYASRDPLARGEYFRWLGVDDWLELDYVSECVAALDANPHCIAVTTDQDHWNDAGHRLYQEYRGPRVDSDQPHERFARMLWFLTAGIYRLDPLFSMYRRQKLASTRLHRLMPRADAVLAAELSLVGPYCHIPRCLAHRRFVYDPPAVVDRRTRPPGHSDFDPSTGKRVRVILSIVREAQLGRYEELYCKAAVLKYYVHEVFYLMRICAYPRLARMARGIGLTRSRLNGLLMLRPRRD